VPGDVVAFLRMQGLDRVEASALVQRLLAERKVTVRANGIKNVVTGTAMLVGFWGAYKIIKGIIMIMAPKSEPGDVSQE
jgi:hypothetical protein